jgi:hypothetical protein
MPSIPPPKSPAQRLCLSGNSQLEVGPIVELSEQSPRGARYRRPRVGQLATMTVGPTAYPVTIVSVDRSAGRVTIGVREDTGRVSAWRRCSGGAYRALGEKLTPTYQVRLGR